MDPYGRGEADPIELADGSTITREQIVAASEAAGYEVDPLTEPQDDGEEEA